VPRQSERRHDRHFARQFEREGVFLEDLRVAPSAGPVKLRHHDRALVLPDLVDAVLVTVQRQQAAIGTQPGGLDRVKQVLGSEVVIRGRARVLPSVDHVFHDSPATSQDRPGFVQ
jgi:hypothetical protein